MLMETYYDNSGLHSKVLLKKFGIDNLNVTIPTALTGPQGHTKNFNIEYFSQLTKKQVTFDLDDLDLILINIVLQVWKLYNIYRVDHELFGYSPSAFIDIAKD